MAAKRWIGTSGGTWTAAANWSPAGAATGLDDATITGLSGTTYQQVSGPGTAASLAFIANTSLSGTFSTGTLLVGTAASPGALSLAAGTVLNASAATLLYGPLRLNGTGARLVVSGALTLGGARANTVSYVGNDLSIANGATVQAGSLVLAPATTPYGTGGSDSITVDTTSTFEAGTTGGAAAGKLTIDAGQTVAGAGSLIAFGGIVNQGTILAQGGTLSLSGPVSGTGQLQIGVGATLNLTDATTEAVTFVGAGGTLDVSSLPFSSPNGLAYRPSEQGTISGFALGDTLFDGGAVTTATYQAGANGTGTLTLANGSTSYGTLTLMGDYSAYSFQVTPPAYGTGANITLVRRYTGGGSPSPGTSSPDAYAWRVAGSGAWGDAANWTDTTTHATPASIAPGVNDTVTLVGSTDGTYQQVTGPGNSASLTLLGSTSLNGSFNTGAVLVGTAVAGGALNVASGAVLNAASATLLNGPLTVSGTGTRLLVSGAVTVGGTRALTGGSAIDALAVSGGAVMQAGSLALPSGSGGFGSNAISVDSTSTLEVGTAGAAAAGALTIDAGQTVAGAGSLTAPGGIVNQGTLVAQSGTLSLSGPMSGMGTLQIGTGARLALNSASTQAVSFAGASGTLSFVSLFSYTGAGPANTPTAQGVISGFALTDDLFDSSTVTSATYHAGLDGTGTLTLADGTTSYGALTLAGDYTGYTFQVTPGTYGLGAHIALVRNTTSTGTTSAGTATPDVYAWRASSGGSWGDAANWTDTTTGSSPANIAPGANNLVTLNGGSGTSVQSVTGPGNAASLTVLGNTALSGVFNAGTLAVGSVSVLGTLNLRGTTVLNAGSATLVHGSASAYGAAAKLAVSGALTVGGSVTGYSGLDATSLTIGGGAAVQAGSIVLQPGGSTAGGVSIVVDRASTLEIGTAGGAAAGAITVDAGTSVSGAGTIIAVAGVVNQGLILAQGGMLSINGATSGAGELQIGAGATLNLIGASTEPVRFTGAGGTLDLPTTVTNSAGGLAYTVAERGTISGFVSGDTLSGPATISSATFQAGPSGTGTLALFSGSTSLGSLTLAGDYTGYTFQVTPGAFGARSNISLVQATVAAPADPLFDRTYYLAHNPDVAAAGVDPYQHYIATGWKEGRNPDALFDTNYYLTTNPDVKAAGINPLAHFEANGWREGRQPSLLFSDSAYLAANPDVAAAGISPLQHYLQYGQAEGRQAGLTGFDGNLNAADPLVNAAFVDAQLGATLLPAGAVAAAQASEIYHAGAWRTGVNPDAFFDSVFYLAQNPDVRAAGVDPLLHFEANGWREGRDPSLLFSGSKYLSANPDVRAASIDPLLHYLTNGQAEGRVAFLSGPMAAADPLVDAAYYDRQRGDTLIPTGTAAQQQAAASYNATGWQRGLNPDAFFDTAYYLSHNPDVAAAHINPLLHYETNGWQEGRDPSASFSTHGYLAAYSDVRNAGVNPLLHYIANGQAEGRTASHV